MEIRVEPIELGEVHLPDWHPRIDDVVAIMRGFVVRHPDGVILFDTGSGDDHDVLNELYTPRVVPIVDALNTVGVDERDVVAIVNSHLHFDHCGQNRALPSVPVWVQATEYEMVETPRFTIAEWARLPEERRRMIDGDDDIAEGVRIIATPGHTPGHQSLMVDDEHGRTVIAGQCCYTCAEYIESELTLGDAHDESWFDTAADSLARVHLLSPDIAHFSHDRTVFRRQP
jgi:glyoxylase-like metal-dependent hydrolase (beta-lactamase superfamily II)